MKKQGSKLDDKDQIEEEVKVVGVQNFSSKTPSPIGFSEAPTIMRQKNQTQVRNRKKDQPTKTDVSEARDTASSFGIRLQKVNDSDRRR